MESKQQGGVKGIVASQICMYGGVIFNPSNEFIVLDLVGLLVGPSYRIVNGIPILKLHLKMFMNGNRIIFIIELN
jgi:hypothetical protein